MKKTFGLGFTITNDVYQALNPRLVGYGTQKQPYVHLATVHRGLKEYCAYADTVANKIWIEELDPSSPGLFKKIQDNNEWTELWMFLNEKRLLELGNRAEIKAGRAGLTLNVPQT